MKRDRRLYAGALLNRQSGSTLAHHALADCRADKETGGGDHGADDKAHGYRKKEAVWRKLLAMFRGLRHGAERELFQPVARQIAHRQSWHGFRLHHHAGDTASPMPGPVAAIRDSVSR